VDNAQKILSKGSTLLKGCWFWSKTLHSRKNFEFHSGGEGKRVQVLKKDSKYFFSIFGRKNSDLHFKSV